MTKATNKTWRSLDELADSPEFQQFLRAEFPTEAEAATDPSGRRNFLKLMGASMALAGVGTACVKQPDELIVPYVKQPENLIPGKPLYYATAMVRRGYATGVLVESHMGRPTKIEGNPRHPASLGRTDAQTQAAVLDLYDPSRLTNVVHKGIPSTWDSFEQQMTAALDAQKAKQGAGVRLVTGNITSPTLAAQIRAFLATYPDAKWVQWEPTSFDNERAGSTLAFGRVINPVYHFDAASVVLSLDSDFASSGPGSVRYAWDLAQRRRGLTRGEATNRLYVAEPSLTPTGSLADHRIRMRYSDVEGLARALAVAVGLRDVGGAQPLQGEAARWFNALVRDLQAAGSRGLVVAGSDQPPMVHALAHAINHALGAVGTTVTYTEPVEAEPSQSLAAMQELVTDLNAGRVDLLVMLATNPVYDAPADLQFANAMQRAQLRVHLGLHDDETGHLCHWQLPATHELEAWGDARAFDGTTSIVQPLISPLYRGRSSIEVMSLLAGKPGKGHDLVQAYWRGVLGELDATNAWRRALHDGIITPPAEAVQPALNAGFAAGRPQPLPGVELVLRADPVIGDGAFANNPWLQELPKPVSKITWDNALLVGPSDAAKMGLLDRHIAKVQAGALELEAPVFVLPGQAEGSIMLHLGYGRKRMGRIATGVGVNAYRLRTTNAMHALGGVTVTSTGKAYAIANTQNHHAIDTAMAAHMGELVRDRGLIRQAPLEEYKKNPNFVQAYEHGPRGISLYPEHKYESGYSWGMTIDVNACSGCGACMVACQAENNIAVVGKEQVLMGREMHWIRVDSYFQGDPRDPVIAHQPVPCMHCENAPCELVCPVNATVHGPEGLNEMVYNRCVGTRYCSNNCPYKVRRFNFTLYTDWETESLKAQRNPDVTPRSRGVMEKCTYCVQRISEARIEAKKEGREVRDGEVVTACQGACPTGAIVFGNLNDADSKVTQEKRSPRNYGILGELNTLPRTTYLAKITNPNPALATEDVPTTGEH